MKGKGATGLAVLMLGIFSIFLLAGCAQEIEDGCIVILASGFTFTEGPASDDSGNIYFTDIPANRIHKWSVNGELSTFREDSGGANGLMFDDEGNLFVCEGGNRRLVRIDPEGEVTVLADSYGDKRLNSPNDLWIDPEGGIYFSDPRYGPRDNLEQDGEHVYYLSPDGERLVRVIDDMVRPNGLVGTPDGTILYVADHGAYKTYSYMINPDGTLSGKKLFARQGSDGMTMDAGGNIYLTGGPVAIYSPEGRKIETIDLPERSSNVCFGGRNGTTLFITARRSFYAVPAAERGPER